MRVLVVTSWFPSADRPGVAPFNVAHAKAIARNHDVQVVHAQLGGTGPIREEHFAGLQVTRIPVNPRTPGMTLRGYRWLRRLARDVDVVHSMAFSSLGVLAPLAPVIGKRWVHSEHWSGVLNPASVSPVWRSVAMARHLLRMPRAVSAVSTELARVLTRFTRRDAVMIVPCVVAESFQAAPQPSWEPLKLVAVGGLVPGKRPLLAVDTLRALVSEGVPARLSWVGDGPLRDEVRKHAAEAGVMDRVDLLGDVSPDKVADHVRASNLFFLPTAYETFLTSGVEAIACGRPVVLPATGGFTDYVMPDNGVLADRDDPATLAQAIMRARDRFADVAPEALRATVIPRFTEAAVAEEFDQLYRRLEK